MKYFRFFLNFKCNGVFLLFFLFPTILFANRQTDSLRSLLYSAKSSCVKYEFLINLSQYFSLKNGDSALFYARAAINQANNCGDKSKIANAFMNQSNALDMAGNYPEAVSSALKALKYFESLGDIKSEAQALHRLGKISFHQSESSVAQLKQGYYKEALVYYRKALSIEKKQNNLLGITDNSIEIGRTLYETGDSDSALILLNNALEISEKNKQQKEFLHDVAKSSYNIALVYIKQEKHEKALIYLAKAAEVDSLLNNKEGVAVIRMAEMYYKLGNADRSIDLAKRSIDTAQRYGYELRVMQASEVLYTAYELKGDYENAFYYLMLHRNLSDSLSNEEHVKEITKMEMQHDFEKREEHEKIKNEAEKKQQRLIIYGIVAVLIFLLAFLIYGVFTFRQKQKAAKIIAEQKKEVEKQKMMVEEKNKEVHDSIVYARRIQNAILPPVEMFNRLFADAFVLYKPKDIVAGDFYFLEQLGDEIIFAVADCTGHGVPGAMVSVVCHNALKRSIKEFGLRIPGEILNRTREIVIEEFGKKNELDHEMSSDDDSIKDGMDIALCHFNIKTKKLQFSGANNPLWILRYSINSGANEIIETKGDKQPIGNFSVMKPFTTHYFDLQTNDCLYLFSDGFADQFGGDKSKKFKSSSLKELILKLENNKMEVQKNEMNTAFENWRTWPTKGGMQDLEQIDDVCIIGVRI